jgi:LEA14-like dessication related protein
MKWFFAIALFAAALTGCATLGGLNEAPRVSLVGIEPVDIQLFEQRYRVTLRLQNPNDRDITIRGLDYEIVVNERVFARGVSGKPVTIPAWGENTAEVEVVSTLWRVMEQLEELGSRDKPSLDYAISGHVNVDGIPIPVPFEYQDTLSLPGLEKRERKDDDSRPRKPAKVAI